MITTEHKRRFKELAVISAPIMLEQVFIMLMGVINVMMVSSVGEHAVSAAGVIDSISYIIIALFSALTTGGTIVVAQYVGQKNLDKAEEAGAQTLIVATGFAILCVVGFSFFRQGIIWSVFNGAEPAVIEAGNTYFMIVNLSFPVLAVMQTVFGVLRGSGDTKTPMLITIVMNVFNVLLGYSLIFGFRFDFFNLNIYLPGYGVAGAAWALVLARFIGMLMGVVYIVRFSKRIRYRTIKAFKLNFAMQKSVLGLGVPTGIENSLFQVGRLITQRYIITMGTSALAANSIGSSIFGFVNVPGMALFMGVMILVGQKIGQGELEDIPKTTFFAVKAGMGLMAVVCLLFFPLTGVIISMYRPGAETALYIRQILYSVYISTPLMWSISFITPAALRATGDVKYTMVVAIASMFCLRVVIGYVLGIVFKFGVLGVWIGMYADWIVRGILFYARMVGGKWRQKAFVR